MTDLDTEYEAALAVHAELEKRHAKEEATQEAARQRLAQIMSQAKSEFGVNSLQELFDLYQRLRSENEQAKQRFVDATQTFRANFLAAEAEIANLNRGGA